MLYWQVYVQHHGKFILLTDFNILPFSTCEVMTTMNDSDITDGIDVRKRFGCADTFARSTHGTSLIGYLERKEQDLQHQAAHGPQVYTVAGNPPRVQPLWMSRQHESVQCSLTLLSPVVTICTAWFNIVKLCILPTQCICVFRMVLIISSDCFPKQH
jgi:hypothetical protein